ncbi:putative rRNA maturation factor [Dokdonella fugitiva]|uniref:Endoribonuclease YbeY n=1 Tax=Dokdonella fugitiva TaxID=328517 RepID=A0A839F0S2_9GAMM|nr:rRNA maturation RNase YbeY [Dokdonella fugitiva]MBA8888206.1 putative rRNA maturation factor [Dokdonella fugitiva]
MKADARRRPVAKAARERADSRVCLWLRNEAGRKGVPVLRTFERWLAAIPDLERRRGWSEINILVVGRAAGRRYNRQFRGRDYATNVLSFPYEPAPGEHSGLLGDLVICAPVVAREAREQGKDARDHFAHMTIHGVLHLLGYDHEEMGEAERMEALETRILAGLGIADPYRDDAA